MDNKDKEKRRAQVREAKRTYREKMRASGLHEIIVWATPAQAEIIKAIAARKPGTDPIADLTPGDLATWKHAAGLTWAGKSGAPAHSLEAVRQRLQEAGHDDMRWSWRYTARLAGIEREEPTEQEICDAVRYLHRQGRGMAEIGALFMQWSMEERS